MPEHLEIAPLRSGSDRWELPPFGGGTNGSSGIHLDGTVDCGSISISSAPRASVTVDAESDKPPRVELELASPPDIGG